MLTTIIASDIDALLPQTQCTKCSYSGCQPYAEAIIAGESINKCHPGGQATVDALAQLLQVDTLPLDAENPAEAALLKYAYIREAECIGCTKCIQACPVDAILGAAKRMHTIIVKECTGCDLCIEPCPVDCIDLLPYPFSEVTARQPPDYFRYRFNARNKRLVQNAATRILRTTTREQTIAVTATDSATQSTLLEKLQRNVDGAHNRVIHAQGKVDIARQYHPEKLMPLLARLQDLQYKYDEAIKKLTAQQDAGESKALSASYITDLLARTKLARGNLTDEQRLDRALQLIQSKISNTQHALDAAEKNSIADREVLRTQLKKLTDKLHTLQQEIAEQKA